MQREETRHDRGLATMRTMFGPGIDSALNSLEAASPALRDMKMSARIEEGASPQQAMLYAELCGRTLAHAHAKSGDAALISGYLGKSDDFDQAIGEFALAYADQNEQDHTALVAAVKAGQIEAKIDENS